MSYRNIYASLMPVFAAISLAASSCASSPQQPPKGASCSPESGCAARARRARAVARLEDRMSALSCASRFVDEVCYDSHSSSVLYNVVSEPRFRDVGSIAEFPELRCEVNLFDKVVTDKIVADVRSGYDTSRSWLGLFGDIGSGESAEGISSFVNAFFQLGCVKAQTRTLSEISQAIAQAEKDGVFVQKNSQSFMSFYHPGHIGR